MNSFPINTILVCGAGTMGTGIALAAAEAGFTTFLSDTDTHALHKAGQQIQKSLGRTIEKRETDAGIKEQTFGLLHRSDDYQKIKPQIVIETIDEDKEAKISLFRDLAKVFPGNTIFATNTSSLPVSAIARAVPRSERVVGMHFFNPVAVMKLVEIAKTAYSDPKIVKAAGSFAKRLGKIPVEVRDAPGFIVNRVAGHFFLEAFRMAEDHIAGEKAIDKLMEGVGFRTGPFTLTDLIGQDVNLAVTESLYAAFHQEPRFRPSRLQSVKVQAGFLGKKTGRGFYEYKKTVQ